MTKTLVLIACSKKKLLHAAPVRTIYRGTLFKYSVRYAEEIVKAPWVVLSTKYGVVFPDQMIEPYSYTLSRNGAAIIGEPRSVIATRDYQREWAFRVRSDLRLLWPETTFVSLLSRQYMDALSGLTYWWPLEGMKLGPRIAWLKLQLGSEVDMYDLFISQIRVLQSLSQGGALSRILLNESCGFSVTSGTLSRVLNGCPENSSSGRPRPGLIQMALITKVELEIEEGIKETVYQITEEGEKALADYLAKKPLPALRSKERSINLRYKEG